MKTMKCMNMNANNTRDEFERQMKVEEYCMLQFHRKWRLNEWQKTGCILGVIWSAAALSRSFATLRATITPRLPKASECMSMMKEAGLLAEPRLKDELRAAAIRA